MLSKEEIKCCKQEAKNYIEFWEDRDNCGWLRGLLWYTEQLETNNKKVIEKLEEVINDDGMSDVEYQTKRELAQEILEIAKGEKE